MDLIYNKKTRLIKVQKYRIPKANFNRECVLLKKNFFHLINKNLITDDLSILKLLCLFIHSTIMEYFSIIYILFYYISFYFELFLFLNFLFSL